MKKRVQFEEKNFNKGIIHQTLKTNRILPDRSFGYFKNELGGVIREKTTDSRIKKSSPLRQIKDPVVATIQIPTTLAEAPFLQQSRLTPGQKHYLCTIAGIYSDEHVWRLLRQHYMNVAHRCIRTDLSIRTSRSLDPSVTVTPVTVAETETLPKIHNKSVQKHFSKGRNTLPKINNQRRRVAGYNLEAKKGTARRSREPANRRNTPATKAGASLSKPAVPRDDDEDSLDELLRALAIDDDEDFL